MVGYVNHQKSHERHSVDTGFSPGTENVTYTMSNKVWKLVSGLKQHMVVHKHQIPQADQSSWVGALPVSHLLQILWICSKIDESFEGT